MITWNIDLDAYTKEQLESLCEIIYSLDYSIAKEIESYLIEKY